MDITPTGGQPAATNANKNTATEESATGAPATDFQTFLTLLTTQLRNQDPLKPMESTEFVAQLASFSGVEQQVRSNDKLEAIYGALGGGASAGLAAWIGREVRAPAKAAFSGVPVEIETTPLEGADKAVLVVTNDFDQVVARRQIDPAASSVSWDGTDELGRSLPHGLYAFEIESYKQDQLAETVPGEVFAKVSEVRIEDGAQVLVLEGGGRAALDSVTAIR